MCVCAISFLLQQQQQQQQVSCWGNHLRILGTVHFKAVISIIISYSCSWYSQCNYNNISNSLWYQEVKVRSNDLTITRSCLPLSALVNEDLHYLLIHFSRTLSVLLKKPLEHKVDLSKLEQITAEKNYQWVILREMVLALAPGYCFRHHNCNCFSIYLCVSFFRGTLFIYLCVYNFLVWPCLSMRLSFSVWPCLSVYVLIVFQSDLFVHVSCHHDLCVLSVDWAGGCWLRPWVRQSRRLGPEDHEDGGTVSMMDLGPVKFSSIQFNNSLISLGRNYVKASEMGTNDLQLQSCMWILRLCTRHMALTTNMPTLIPPLPPPPPLTSQSILEQTHALSLKGTHSRFIS